MRKNSSLRLVDADFLEPRPARQGRSKARKGTAKAASSTREDRFSQGAHEQPVWSRAFVPRTEGQLMCRTAIRNSDITLAIGPAGTGKTRIAITAAVEALDAGTVQRIVLARPAVEAGEKLGFMPGDMHQKLDPYMRPLFDALLCCMSPQKLSARMADGTIEVTGVGFLRGRNLSGCALVIDEAQNLTWTQVVLVLSRLTLSTAQSSPFIVMVGDPTQIDLPAGTSGFLAMADKLRGRHARISVVEMTIADVVRHPTVKALLEILA